MHKDMHSIKMMIKVGLCYSRVNSRSSWAFNSLILNFRIQHSTFQEGRVMVRMIMILVAWDKAGGIACGILSMRGFTRRHRAHPPSLSSTPSFPFPPSLLSTPPFLTSLPKTSSDSPSNLLSTPTHPAPLGHHSPSQAPSPQLLFTPFFSSPSPLSHWLLVMICDMQFLSICPRR